MGPPRGALGRPLVLAGAAAAALGVVAGRVGWLALVQGDHWRLQSLANRRAILDLPVERGALLDRRSLPLAADEPGFAVELVYRTFRKESALGLAVHGVRHAFEAGYRMDPALEPQAWDLADPPERLRDAARIVAFLPSRWVLRRGSPLGSGAADMRFYVFRLLARAAGTTPREVERAVAAAAEADPARPAALALGLGVEQVTALVDRALEDLAALEEIVGMEPGAMAAFLAARDRILAHRSTQGMERFRMETSAVAVARDLPFERAARIVLERERFPGFQVAHSVRRVWPAAGILGVEVAENLLGTVASGSGRPGVAALLEELEGYAHHEEEDRVRRSLHLPPGEWREFSRRLSLQIERARERRMRHGVRGLERALDAVLQGEAGLRHVERDHRAREVRQLGFAGPSPGQDVTLTLDARLQAMAEAVLQEEPLLAAAGEEGGPLRAGALVVMDARTGDLWAVAGHPRQVPAPSTAPGGPPAEERRMVPLELHPGGSWPGSGRVGSLLKPLLAAEALSRDPALGERFRPCQGTFHLVSAPSVVRGCEGVHGAWDQRGRDPVEMALGASCNVYFFQCGLALGTTGIREALERFLLLPAAGRERLLAAEHASLEGLRWEPGRWERGFHVEMRGVGYGVEASALSMARAYAALGTGHLPSPRLVAAVGGRAVAGAGRRPLPFPPGALQRVRAGLEACTFDPVAGTARRSGLERFRVAGKTGTPEFEVAGVLHNNVWFAGYGPLDAPRFAVACVLYAVPHGVHAGGAAAPVVARLLEKAAGDPTLAALLWGEEAGR